MPKIKVDGVSLYYEVRGKGHPVLLIAGLGSDVLSWAGVAGKLSAHFKLIAFDNRGVGRSDIPDKRYTIRQMARDAVSLLDHLKIKKAHVIGHSMGGYIAQELAINYPERVDKLILESTSFVSSKRNNLLFSNFYRRLKEGESPKVWMCRWTRWLFSKKSIARKTFVETFTRNVSNHPYLQKAEGFKGQIGAIASFDTRRRLCRIKAETLIMEGEEDKLILPKEAAALAKNISGSIFQSIKETAHCIHIEDPGQFVRAVMKFLLPGLTRDRASEYLLHSTRQGRIIHINTGGERS